MEEYILEKDGRKRRAVRKTCAYCGKEFLVRASWEERQMYCSCKCAHENSKKRIMVICAYCGKPFEKVNNRLSSSKSGLYFCCRKHKDRAQSLKGGIKEVMPKHYGTGNGRYDYRHRAFEEYEHKCAICGWCEDERVLEVHHIDEDRANNDITNLMILCPICHRYLTLHLYTVEELKQRRG